MLFLVNAGWDLYLCVLCYTVTKLFQQWVFTFPNRSAKRKGIMQIVFLICIKCKMFKRFQHETRQEELQFHILNCYRCPYVQLTLKCVIQLDATIRHHVSFCKLLLSKHTFLKNNPQAIFFVVEYVSTSVPLLGYHVQLLSIVCLLQTSAPIQQSGTLCAFHVHCIAVTTCTLLLAWYVRGLGGVAGKET